MLYLYIDKYIYDCRSKATHSKTAVIRDIYAIICYIGGDTSITVASY